MSNRSNNSNGGIGFAGVLTCVFVGLKLAEVGVVANWSWLWVLSPLWIAFLIAVFILILIEIFY